ncbi:MAG TPA: FtsX-like permease family protein [Thiothrix sp.]|nr:FtsX-like permease family protein [Thiothrix sp.]
MTKKNITQAATTSSFTAGVNQLNDAFHFSLKRLWFNPLATWITFAVIALALALPTGLYVLLINLEGLTSEEREVPTISLFLKQTISEQEAYDHAILLSEKPEISNVAVITRNQAADKFKQITGFSEILETLGKNPLPHVLVVTPRLNLLGQLQMDFDSFAADLKNYGIVDNVQIDVEWVQRLKAIIQIAERVTLVIALLLGITVLLVIGNTIRLDIESRKDEIEILKMMGATNAYIRRPFLFSGIWYGLFGGIFSLVIVHFSLLFLISPVNQLAQLYGSEFIISGVGIRITINILVLSALLGMLGAWIAVGRHLKQAYTLL